MLWQKWAQGKPCEVVAAYGIDPAIFMAGSLVFGPQESELGAAGALMGRPVEMTEGAVGPLPGNMTKSPSGYVVVASLSAARAPYASFPMWIMILGVVGLLAAVGAAVLTAMRFLMPLDAIERGVAEVINGNQEYTFESPSQDFEGLPACFSYKVTPACNALSLRESNATNYSQ